MLLPFQNVPAEEATHPAPSVGAAPAPGAPAPGAPQTGAPGGPGPSGPQPQEPSSLSLFLPIVLMIALMYFVVFRPERKRQKELTKMRSEMKKGDRVVTSSGILGTIAALSDDVVTLEIADKVRVQFQRSAVAQVVESKEKAEVVSA